MGAVQPGGARTGQAEQAQRQHDSEHVKRRRCSQPVRSPGSVREVAQEVSGQGQYGTNLRHQFVSLVNLPRFIISPVTFADLSLMQKGRRSSQGPIFHLAIPSHDIDASVEFYAGKLGCPMGRHNQQWAIFNFFGGQLVCHLDPEACDRDPQMYPRHFGISFTSLDEYSAVLEKIENLPNVLWFRQPFVRYEGQPQEHRSFFIRDPSNNLIEFKWYRDASAIY